MVDVSIINPMQNYAIRPTLDKVISSRFSKEARNMNSVSDFLVELKETESCYVVRKRCTIIKWWRQRN